MSKPPIPPTPAAYASDWKHFAAWCRRQNLAALPPDPEVVGPDVGRDQTEDGRGWIEILDKGLLVTLRGKTGWRQVEIGRGSPTIPISPNPLTPD
jgi:hypothetical protein